jgi:hypothetical protein
MNAKKHAVPEELLSGLLADYKKPEDLIGENGLLCPYRVNSVQACRLKFGQGRKLVFG